MPKEPIQFIMYLAGPMDGISKDDASGWRETLALAFPEIVFFLPNEAYRNSAKKNGKVVDHINRHVIQCCSAVIANLTGPGRAFGTIREIEFARSLTRYVGVACDPDGDIAQHSLMTHDLHLTDTPEQAVIDALTFLSDSRAAHDRMDNLMISLGGILPAEEEGDPEDG